MKVNPKTEETVILNTVDIEEVIMSEFVYLKSKITVDGNSGKDVQSECKTQEGNPARSEPAPN